MTEITFYENPNDLINRYSDNNDAIDNLVSQHIFVCLANESFRLQTPSHPIFNTEYLCALVRGAGATASELEAMAKLLRSTKDNKESVSNWWLLFDCVKSEANRRQMDTATLLAGLND